ncbi:CaiB/BaiF CoA transferase family protein [Pseudoroseomonas ludipueritiae]|uniref:CoA transferase n=1 Tax=Pseudoroseomonas ludipueritiae TaxID=198093 RepID=A0ABR7RBU2_9PROT|nr:CoA transferase [Pseudoroseomonas ludipueritiae]MBC9179148.1 CoA transferase [Pseudoroseomonas ludipueritiae]MCG7364295.1 CoA transferase [Roseomonas sp. ACRSG]
MTTTTIDSPTRPGDTAAAGPLSGLRVLELGHFVAAPFCTRLLGDLGADVIKVEPPGAGDPVRQWGARHQGHSAWWSVHGRNKRCITLDLKKPRAKELALRLAAQSDALVENFRPGQLDKLGLSEAALREARPDLVIARVSGYGQDGPQRDRAAFGVIGEAVGGLRHLTNHPPGNTDLPPVRVGISIGDSVAGLYAAFGVMAALWRRDAAGRGDQRGRTLDVALTESIFSLLEGALPEYGALGTVRQPAGGAIATAAPSNAYRSRDGVWVLIAANSDPLFRRLADLMGRPELAGDPRYQGNQARVANRDTLDAHINAWTAQHEAAELERMLEAADVPATRAYTVADCAADAQFRHRGMVREVEDAQLGRMLHPGIVPQVPDDPGAIRWAGPSVGAHNEEVFSGLLNLSADEITALRQEGVC